MLRWGNAWFIGTLSKLSLAVPEFEPKDDLLCTGFSATRLEKNHPLVILELSQLQSKSFSILTLRK